ncbi:SprT-like domain-containing protein [Pseudohalioglobus lutimaris]|uniref:Metallopeptidase (SprT family) n=1 Tax=Pseudohalioglobus lutimaris TaxID=1737061 RepID=A0A2N5X7L8_9GAMM|nr:SprT-like domain-containing protein [Pseudohalioglobus lutimaris]PLW70486.1 metallopeptidase (SprT family) [Pseudohalioglobus lutimaris]
MIEPIDEAQRQQVLARTEHYITTAEEVLERPFERIPVLFDLRGTTAGMFRAHRRRREIRYNPWIFSKYWQLNLDGTVPHEVAHYIVHEVYGVGKVKPHGVEWQALMHYFNADPEVTFKLDLEGIPQRRQRTHPYRCGCREHQVSTTRHNRMRKGQGSYLCRYCEAHLVYCA